MGLAASQVTGLTVSEEACRQEAARGLSSQPQRLAPYGHQAKDGTNQKDQK